MAFPRDERNVWRTFEKWFETESRGRLDSLDRYIWNRDGKESNRTDGNETKTYPTHIRPVSNNG